MDAIVRLKWRCVRFFFFNLFASARLSQPPPICSQRHFDGRILRCAIGKRNTRAGLWHLKRETIGTKDCNFEVLNEAAVSKIKLLTTTRNKPLFVGCARLSHASPPARRSAALQMPQSDYSRRTAVRRSIRRSDGDTNGLVSYARRRAAATTMTSGAGRFSRHRHLPYGCRLC